MANINGTPTDDILDGTTASDNIVTGAGNDWIFGSDGNDHLDLGVELGQAGAGSDGDRGYGGFGNDWIAGRAGNDYLVGDFDDGTTWTHGNDKLYGGAGDDWLDGGGGINRLSGSTGNDTLINYGDRGSASFGGDGNDFLGGTGRQIAGAGNDWIVSHTGNGVSSTLSAGTGADHVDAYLMGSADPNAEHTSLTIQDFDRDQGDQLFIGATVDTPLGVYASSGEDLFRSFDSNGSGTLGDGDTYANVDGHGGVVAHWFNTDLILHGDQTHAADWAFH